MGRENIQEFGHLCKVWLDDTLKDWGIFALILLVAMASFGLGRLSALEGSKGPIPVIQEPLLQQARALPAGGYVVGSRGGTVYYFPWCGGAEKIAASEQVWFPSEKDAQKSGYTPAGNCKGLTSQ